MLLFDAPFQQTINDFVPIKEAWPIFPEMLQKHFHCASFY